MKTLRNLVHRFKRFRDWYRWATNTPLTEEEKSERQTFGF